MTILTDEQKQLIRDLAAREGIKLEAWISRCIVDGMGPASGCGKPGK